MGPRCPADSAIRIGQVTKEISARSDGVILIRKVTTGNTRGRMIVAGLRGRGDVAMTTDEIMAVTRGD